MGLIAHSEMVTGLSCVKLMPVDQAVYQARLPLLLYSSRPLINVSTETPVLVDTRMDVMPARVHCTHALCTQCCSC